MEDTKTAPPQIVVAKMVKDADIPTDTRGPNLFALLEPDAVQLKAAATCLFCWSLAQLFTLHGFLGCIASAVVVFYAESSPLGTAHAARFTHPLAIATAIFSAGALAATMIVALAVIPSVPVEEMMQACQDAQEGNGPWAMGVEMHGYPFPKAQMQHDGFAGDMGYPYSGQPDFVLPTEPEDGMMYALTDDMMYAYAVDSVEMSEQAMPMYHEAHHDHDDHHAHAEYQGYHHHEEHEYEHDHHEDAHHDMHHEGEEHKDHEEEEEEHERPQLYREMYFDPPPEEPQPASAEVPRRPIQTESPVMSRAWGARRLQEMAIDNCDEMVEYMNSYLPVILMVNMLVQGGLLFSAMSVAKRAGLLLLKARQLGAQAL